MCAMSVENIREIIKRELPILVGEDEELRDLIRRLYRTEFASRAETNDRFDQLLAELRQDREEQNRKWEENRVEREKDREEQARKWEQHRLEREKDREEQNRKWEENRLEREKDREEQNRKWEENREENTREFDRVHEEIMALAQKQERDVGALGARWGLKSEATFRNALAGILEKSFGVEVINVTEYDDEGIVFGQPDQIELDVIIKNGVLILCELKSSMSKSDMYIFGRKASFYEEKHRREVSRKLVISPMIDQRAEPVAKKLGIECYSDSLDVAPL